MTLYGRVFLEILLNTKINLLAFPYNEYNKKILKLAKDAGYKRTFSGHSTFNSNNSDEFLYGRINVSPDDWPIEFTLKLMGGYNWLPFGVDFKRKILYILRVLKFGKKKIR